ncbi:unnamed protein product, partial [Pylaiella littoralis]
MARCVGLCASSLVSFCVRMCIMCLYVCRRVLCDCREVAQPLCTLVFVLGATGERRQCVKSQNSGLGWCIISSLFAYFGRDERFLCCCATCLLVSCCCITLG